MFHAVLFFITLACAHAQQTWFVNVIGSDTNSCTRTEPCSTIGRAVSLASRGDTVKLQLGTFVEKVVIPPELEGITLEGVLVANRVLSEIEVPFGETAAVEINAADVTVRNLVLRVGVDGDELSSGVHITSSGTNTMVSNLVIRNDLDSESDGVGIIVEALFAQITGNIITGAWEVGIEVAADNADINRNTIRRIRGAGMLLAGATSADIRFNTIRSSNSDCMIIDESSSGNSFTRNKFRTCGFKCIDVVGNSNVFESNGVTDCGDQAIAVDGNDNTFMRNRISNAFRDCVDLIGNANAFTLNRFQDCGEDGMTVFGDNNEITTNTFTNTGEYGLNLLASTSSNLIWRNVFFRADDGQINDQSGLNDIFGPLETPP